MFFNQCKQGFALSESGLCRVGLRKKKKGGLIQSVQNEALADQVLSISPTGQNILSPEDYRTACLKLLAGCATGSCYALSLPEQCVRIKQLSFESLPKDDVERDQVLAWQMAQSFLTPLKPVHVVFKDCGLKRGKRSLLVLTIEKEILAAYEAPFVEKKMEAFAIGIFPLHLYNLYHSTLLEAATAHRHLIFSILHERALTVLICREGQIDFVRIKSQAPDDTASIIDEMQHSLTAYEDTQENSELSHVFLYSDATSSDLDSEIKEAFGLTPVHLKPETSAFFRLTPPRQSINADALSAALAVLEGSS